MSELKLEGVRKNYGAGDVIHGIDLAVKSGEFIAFVGPSGCGKSTLLRMIAGLETISAGQLSIGGINRTSAAPADRRVAMVFQNYALYPHMTARQNLSFGMRMNRKPRAEIAARVEHAASLLRLEALLDRKPGELSGGQNQRVAIGRAIVQQPDIFLFDEPLSNLDAELRVHMRHEIAALHRKLGTTMIYVTHDQSEAMTLADRIVVLREGRVEQVDTPQMLYNRPATIFTAQSFGTPPINIVNGTVIEQFVVRLTGGACLKIAHQLPVGTSVQLGIRPEHLFVAEAGTLAAHVEYVENLGSIDHIYAKDENTEIRFHSSSKHYLRPGSKVNLTVHATDILIFDQQDNLIA